MKNTKEFMTNFLKGTGASEETIAQFGELYDKETQEEVNRIAQGNMYQAREATENIQAMASRHNIRNK